MLKLLLIFVFVLEAKVFLNTTDASVQSDSSLYESNVEAPNRINKYIAEEDPEEEVEIEEESFQSGLVLYLYPQPELVPFQVGMLAALEHYNIKVDYVYGSAWGALLGHLWLNGVPAKEIAKLFRENSALSEGLFPTDSLPNVPWVSPKDYSSIQSGWSTTNFKKLQEEKNPLLALELGSEIAKYPFSSSLRLVQSGPQGAFLEEELSIEQILVGFKHFPEVSKLQDEWYWDAQIYGDLAHELIEESVRPQILLSPSYKKGLEDPLANSLRESFLVEFVSGTLAVPVPKNNGDIQVGFTLLQDKVDFILKKIKSKKDSLVITKPATEWLYALDKKDSEFHSNIRHYLDDKNSEEVHNQLATLIQQKKYKLDSFQYETVENKRKLSIHAHSLDPLFLRFGGFANLQHGAVGQAAVEWSFVSELRYTLLAKGWGSLNLLGGKGSLLVDGWEGQKYYLKLGYSYQWYKQDPRWLLSEKELGTDIDYSIGYRWTENDFVEASFVQEEKDITIPGYVVDGEEHPEENFDVQGLRLRLAFHKQAEGMRWNLKGTSVYVAGEAKNYTLKDNTIEKGDLIFGGQMRLSKGFQVWNGLHIQLYGHAGIAVTYDGLKDGKKEHPSTTFRSDFLKNGEPVTNPRLERRFQIPMMASLYRESVKAASDYSNEFVHGKLSFVWDWSLFSIWLSPQYLLFYNDYVSAYQDKKYLEGYLKLEWKSWLALGGMEHDIDRKTNAYFLQLGHWIF